jgi:hypothetical protein
LPRFPSHKLHLEAGVAFEEGGVVLRSAVRMQVSEQQPPAVLRRLAGEGADVCWAACPEGEVVHAAAEPVGAAGDVVSSRLQHHVGLVEGPGAASGPGTGAGVAELLQEPGPWVVGGGGVVSPQLQVVQVSSFHDAVLAVRTALPAG